ncbi:MAG: hypothetical protein MJ252_26555 [archaeon]|nr:hypothetical protein [archaeon]
MHAHDPYYPPPAYGPPHYAPMPAYGPPHPGPMMPHGPAVVPAGGVVVTYPGYRQLTVGPGIDMREYTRIVNAAVAVHTQYGGGNPGTAQAVVAAIRAQIGGEWGCLITDLNLPAYDFSVSRRKGGDTMIFALDNKKYDIFRC